MKAQARKVRNETPKDREKKQNFLPPKKKKKCLPLFFLTQMLKTAMSGSVGTLLQLILGGEGIRGLVENSVQGFWVCFLVALLNCGVGEYS